MQVALCSDHPKVASVSKQLKVYGLVDRATTLARH